MSSSHNKPLLDPSPSPTSSDIPPPTSSTRFFDSLSPPPPLPASIQRDSQPVSPRPLPRLPLPPPPFASPPDPLPTPPHNLHFRLLRHSHSTHEHSSSTQSSLSQLSHSRSADFRFSSALHWESLQNKAFEDVLRKPQLPLSPQHTESCSAACLQERHHSTSSGNEQQGFCRYDEEHRSTVQLASVGPSSRRTGSVSFDYSATSRIAQSGTWSHLSSELLRSGSMQGSGVKDPDKRIVYINNPLKTNERYEYAGNKVRTSKYTVLSFLPRNLFEQFHRIAYVYFLVILCLNQIPQLAVFGRTASLLPLLFVLVVTAIKDGYEDFRRHRSDMKENYRDALVFENGEYKPKAWKHIQVGEVVKVQANETIPCDLVLLRTSDTNGVAYVQTINLDGESNLKTRYARLETAARLEAAERLRDSHPINGKIICEKPNRNIYGFAAYAELDGKQLPLGPTNIILRGCELKNTSWVIGVAVYTGQETKAMLNSAGAQSKRSRLEQNMNRETLWLSLFLFVICFVGGLGTGLWLGSYADGLFLPYYGKIENSFSQRVKEGIFAFLSCLISFQIMIPISLYISMELVRLGQSYFMIQDKEMYHRESNTRFQCRALNINEDLGQIKYVFSDKTGTLTENKMEFCSASIFGKHYSHSRVTVAPVGSHESSLELNEEEVIAEVPGHVAWKPTAAEVRLNTELVQMLQVSDQGMEKQAVQDFMLTLAACNTVVPTKVRMTSSGNLKMELAIAADEGASSIEYQGESPDELALVSAAALYGYTLLERTSNYIIISVLGEIQRYEVLGVHEFDSARKCMSVVVQCPNGLVKVLVKGADSSVLNMIALPGEADPVLSDEHGAQIISDTKVHIDIYSKGGLRTLVIAARDLNTSELNRWQELYAIANASLSDRMKWLHEASQVIENGLFLLGATGIEDKLQDGVSEAIATLREAGIKVWVLTGDKQETAISIGFSCALLTDDMHQVIINESEKEACCRALKSAKAAYVLADGKIPKFAQESVLQDQNFKDVNTMGAGHKKPLTLQQLMEIDSASSEVGQGVKSDESLALIIDGNSLVHALEDDLKQELFELATACKVVICCRVAPLQKAGIVALVKERSKEMTLAIGDGANDVSMIQMADIGVGISGQEGRQAVLASDFAMGQFRFLKRLLLVHGHLNYRRLGQMVLYNFYRNAVFVMLLFWYILYTAYSTSPAITEWSLVLYSLIYTSVPTIIVGILDRDLDDVTLLRFPGLYRGGQKNQSYNRGLFWLTMLDTLWQSLVLFFVPVLTFQNSIIDIWSIGSIWTIAVVIVVNIHLLMDTEQLTWIIHLAIWGSIAATYICIVILDILKEETSLPHYWVVFHIAAIGCYWLDILLIISLALLPRFTCKVMKQTFWPSDVQIAREKEFLKT